MGSRAFSHDSIFIPDGRTESEQAIQAMSQENVLGKVKTLQVRNCKWEKYLKCGGKWSLELQNILSVNKGGLLSGPGGLFFSCVNYLAKSCVNSLDNLQEVWVLVLKGTAVMLQAWNCMGVCILWNSYELNSWDWRLLILMPCLQMWWGKKKSGLRRQQMAYRVRILCKAHFSIILYLLHFFHNLFLPVLWAVLTKGRYMQLSTVRSTPVIIYPIQMGICFERALHDLLSLPFQSCIPFLLYLSFCFTFCVYL